MSVQGEYINEESERKSFIVKSPDHDFLIVICMVADTEEKYVVCGDLDAAHTVAQEWVEHGTSDEEE